MSHEQTVDEIAENFIELTKYASDTLMAKSATIKIFIKILTLLLKNNKFWFIENIGPFFYRFRKEVEMGDIKFFIEHDYKSQYDDWLAITHGYGKFIADGVLESIRQSLSEENKKSLVQCGKGLLSFYCRYLLIRRQEIKNGSYVVSDKNNEHYIGHLTGSG